MERRTTEHPPLKEWYATRVPTTVYGTLLKHRWADVCCGWVRKASRWRDASCR